LQTSNSKNQHMVYEALDNVASEISRLSHAITQNSIVLEGINSQLYLLREEMVRSRTAQEDLIDNDVIFKAIVSEEISNILNSEESCSEVLGSDA